MEKLVGEAVTENPMRPVRLVRIKTARRILLRARVTMKQIRTKRLTRTHCLLLPFISSPINCVSSPQLSAVRLHRPSTHAGICLFLATSWRGLLELNSGCQFIGLQSPFHAFNSKRELKRFARSENPQDLATFMPEQVFTGIYLALILRNISPDDDTSVIYDTRMEAIKKKAVEDGFTCDRKQKQSDDRFIHRGNEITTTENKFYKNVIQIICLQFYFNLRGWFSTVTEGYKNADPDETKTLRNIVNLVVKWIRTYIPDHGKRLFPSESSMRVSSLLLTNIISQPHASFLLTSLS